MPNFTAQDVLGSIMAFVLYPLVFVMPGYLLGSCTGVFAFRRRLPATTLGISVVLSVSVSPMLAYLLCRFLSVTFAILLLVALAAVWMFVLWRRGAPRMSPWAFFSAPTRQHQIIACVCAAWTAFAVAWLVDIQVGARLYNSIVDHDLATRTMVIDAIYRSGVPPINPTYYPGHPVYIQTLYYFWYVLCALIQTMGFGHISSRAAMIASVAWCGIILIAGAALYARLRAEYQASHAWRSAAIAIGLLLVSGLDIAPALAGMITTRLHLGYMPSFMSPPGDIEHWNEQITAWVGSLLWVPHHVAAMVACLTAFMVIQWAWRDHLANQVMPSVLAGLALASAAGLSIWVTLTFALFWAVWIADEIFLKREGRRALQLVLVGVTGAFIASPFLLGLLISPVGDSQIPIVVQVRTFAPLQPAVERLPVALQSIAYAFALPVNYGLELGGFFLAAFVWLDKRRRHGLEWALFGRAELCLLLVVVLVGSFFRSTAYSSNDLAWRSWLFGQFVLLFWAADVLHDSLPRRFSLAALRERWHAGWSKVDKLMAILLVIGVATSAVDALFLRTWPWLVEAGIAGFPNGMSPDTKLGERRYAARMAYGFIGENLPPGAVVQPNPAAGLDWASGLYGTRQEAISPNARYDVPPAAFSSYVADIGAIYGGQDSGPASWQQIDAICKHYAIDVIVVSDLDPLWQRMPVLTEDREPLYANRYYDVMPCGDFAQRLSVMLVRAHPEIKTAP